MKFISDKYYDNYFRQLQWNLFQTIIMTIISDPPMVSAVSPAVSGSGQNKKLLEYWEFNLFVNLGWFDFYADIYVDLQDITFVEILMTKIMTTTLTAKMVLISLPPVGLLSLGCSVSGEPPPTLDWFKYDFFFNTW